MAVDPTLSPVAVIGTGAMGSGIGQVAARAGHQVHLVDAFECAAAAARDRVASVLSGLASKGKITRPQAESATANLHVAATPADLPNCGLVIEAIREDLAEKRALFSALAGSQPAGTLFASNTSSLDIAAIAQGLPHPGRVLGLHFFNPPPLMRLVEVIRGQQTSDESVVAATVLMTAWGKTTVRCTSTPGFIVNRVARPFYGEAQRMVEQGVADDATIDWALRELGGFRMGPLELTDSVHDRSEAGPVAGQQGEVVDLPVITPRPDLYDEAETWSLDELRARQLERLQWSVKHAYSNVEHYRNVFDAKGIHPDDIKSLDDVRLLPLTSKADLRANYPFGMFAVPREQVVRIHASSGSTGKPTVVGYTADDIAMWSSVVARSIRAAGIRPGDVMHVAYGYGLFTGGLGAHYGAEALGCTVIPMSGGQTEKQIQLIQDFRPRGIMVTPSYFLSMLDEMQRQGIDPRSTSLQVGIFGGEPWTDAMRHEIQERGGMHAVDIFGLSEVIGPGVAQECVETKDGLHIWEDHFYPEVVNPLTDEPVEDGQIGELVFTSLTKQAMPVMRYRTRDLTRLLPGTARPGFRRMEKVTGRTDDLMIVRGVNVFPTQIEEIVLGVPGLSPYFQCVLTRPGRLDEMTVNVEADPSTPEASREGLAREVQHRIKSGIGTSARVNVIEPGGIERSVGKARRIIDQRSANLGTVR